MKKIYLLVLPLILIACPYGYKYNSASIPAEVMNLEAANSEYDDYNLSAPFIRDEFPFCFSSNRNSMGQQMDIVYKLMALDFDKDSGEFDFYNETNGNLDVVIRNNALQYLISKANTPQNEFGPYVLSYWYNLIYSIPAYSNDEAESNDFLMLFAREENDQLDIKYVTNFKEEATVRNVKSINTENNEAYPSFNEDFSELYYCSDKEGNFDIVKVAWGPDEKLELSLADTLKKEALLIGELNSSFEDKCPFIDRDILVFTSNRPGGYGGYDLYYSKKTDDGWSSPVNFGDKINTSHDEYRPVLRQQNEFENDLLLFSSNRPGGKGGFDLYYVGVDFE